MEDGKRRRRAIEDRGVEGERGRGLRRDHRRRARQVDHHAHLADDLARAEPRELDRAVVAAPLPLDLALALEDEVDRRRWLALLHEPLAALEGLDAPTPAQHHDPPPL